MGCGDVLYPHVLAKCQRPTSSHYILNAQQFQPWRAQHRRLFCLEFRFCASKSAAKRFEELGTAIGALGHHAASDYQEQFAANQAP
jgi:hypothetical protein